MSMIRRSIQQSSLSVLVVICLAALTSTSVFASGGTSPVLATDVIGSPDAAVNGKLAVGSSSVGSKSLTVSGVIDFVGAGTVHNYFSQGGGNNMQINTNVDEGNAVGDASKSQWKLVLGSSLDQFSIRRSPAGGTYDEDALFWIEGSTGNVGMATVDTGNAAPIPLTLQGKLHVQTDEVTAVYALTTATSGATYAVSGQANSNSGRGVYGVASATGGATYGVFGQANSINGTAVYGVASATSGTTYGVSGRANSTSGRGVYGIASATSGPTYGVYGLTLSPLGTGVYGIATATDGSGIGVYGQADSTSGTGLFGFAAATSGSTYGVQARSDSPTGYGIAGVANATTGANYGVYGITHSTSGYGVYYSGGLAGTGTKSAIVDTKDYGWRLLYAVESPQNWFEDFGEATLSGGEAVVAIDPIFGQTVNLDDRYHVFLTPGGEGCTLYVAGRSSTSFTVRANEGSSCEIAFDYRIVAPRLDYESLRLEPAQDPAEVEASLSQPD